MTAYVPNPLFNIALFMLYCIPSHRAGRVSSQVTPSNARTRPSHKDSRPLFFRLFPVDGDGSDDYGRMMACSE
jgi:hypothetical protein